MERVPNIEKKRLSGKRPKKFKFHGNVHTRKKHEEANLSASCKKLKSSKECQPDESAELFEGYRIFDQKIFFSCLEQHLACKVCGSEIAIKEEITNGLSSKFVIKCPNCIEVCTIRNSRMSGAKKNIPEINRRFVYAMRCIGKGRAAMRTFCGVMDLPPPIKEPSYNAVVKKILKATSEVSTSSMKRAAQEEAIETNSSTNVVVSGDGTWKTRGHSSRTGVCTIIGDQTGKVLDVEVLSSYCKACDSWKGRRKSSAYEEWKASHQGECLNNHSGSAGKMEVVGMQRIFERSEQLRGVKYVAYIGDGDTKTFHSISAAQPYGPTISIEKIECVGHIQKRMGSRLRKLKQSMGSKKLQDGKSIGGKGRLTDKAIDMLTTFYGNAIRGQKDSVIEMRKSIWALFYHKRSNDENQTHNFCPKGADSWCKFQQAVEDGDESQYHDTNSLPECVMDAIKPIFKDLSDPKLLSRCLGGKTQNPNESLNNLIWRLCPKTSGAGRRIVEIATHEAVVAFNNGSNGRLSIMKELDLQPGIYAKDCMQKLDSMRISCAERRSLESTKEKRQAKRREKKSKDELSLLQEGILYAPGEF